MFKFDRVEELAFDCYEAWFKVNGTEKSIFLQGVEALREFAGVDDMAGSDIDYIEKKIKRCESDYEVLFEN